MFGQSRYTYAQVLTMTFDELGGIDDPVLLTATGRMSPMIARYIIRTGQLPLYAGMALPDLLHAIDAAATPSARYLYELWQKMPAGIRVPEVDAYLARLNIAR